MILVLIVFISSVFVVGNASNEHFLEKAKVGEFVLTIYLPPNYSSLRKHKVLYFNDGQTLFGNQGLGAEEEADELIRLGRIEPIIMVGIHSDRNRTSYYVPYEDASVAMDFGTYRPLADWYTRKIIKDIIPYIDSRYGSGTEIGIAGYSFGGLHATWAALNYPEHFLFSGALSPSYWVSDFEIFREGGKASRNQTYYFDVGTKEWNYYVPMLLHTKLPMLKNIFYYENFGGRHSIGSWRGDRIRNILLLFAGSIDPTKYTWKIDLEIIRSEFTEKFYPRINPVITYSNGVTASISYAAKFMLLNVEDGIVYKDGSFRFIHPNDLNIKIEYLGEERMITISHEEVERKMKEP